MTNKLLLLLLLPLGNVFTISTQTKNVLINFSSIINLSLTFPAIISLLVCFYLSVLTLLFFFSTLVHIFILCWSFFVSSSLFLFSPFHYFSLFLLSPSKTLKYPLLSPTLSLPSLFLSLQQVQESINQWRGGGGCPGTRLQLFARDESSWIGIFQFTKVARFCLYNLFGSIRCPLLRIDGSISVNCINNSLVVPNK